MLVPRKDIAVVDGPIAGFPGVVRGGPLLFVSGCDGHRDPATGRIVPALAAEAERQCENAYGRIAELLHRAGSSMDRVVRLDHFTSSQDWLPRRQTVRQRIFGKPAPLASTGVAAKMNGLNMITASAIAVADPSDKELLVAGPRYGMANIAAAVRGGPFVFVSGIRGTLDPRSGARVAEETPEAFGAQTTVCYEVIQSILAECHCSGDSILRLDAFIRNAARGLEHDAIRAELLGPTPGAATRVALPLSARGEVEITALAAAPGVARRSFAAGGEEPVAVAAGGFVFVGECRGLPSNAGERTPLIGDARGQLRRAVQMLEAALRRAGTSLANLVRLDVYLRDIYNADEAARQLAALLHDSPPSIVIAGAELEDSLEVKLSAIAVAA
ncbi:MAG TPA: Rid family hydrolase [Casimicrobiaceae bacterium]|nr:Rid family hydrolase [Casimicrobiaceae bacterium]